MMKGATRVITIGSGLAGVVSAIIVAKNSACVDLIEKSSSIGGSTKREFEIDLNEENSTFLKECGVDPSQIKKDHVTETLITPLINYLHTFPVHQVRIITNTEVTSFLTDSDCSTTLGVHFTRTVCGVDGKDHSNEGNLFGDSIIFAVGQTIFKAVSSKSFKEIKDGKVYNSDNKIITDLHVSKDLEKTGNSLNDLISEARKAGFEASKTKPRNMTISNTRQPLPFTDKDGVRHGIALSPTEWRPLVLENRIQLNKFNHLFRFALPNKSDQAGVFCGQYIAIRAILSGQEVVRYYSPVSRNSDYGHIDLMIKIEENLENKPMARHVQELKVGDSIDFKGPMGGFEYHRNTYREIGMIAGGTGITPMVQIIRSVANHPEDDTKITLLYGNYVEDDILCRDELCYYNTTRSNIKVFITLNNCPAKWSMGSGFINEEMIKKTLPAPAKDIIILLCGPPPMIKTMIQMLKNLGYTDEMIFSFV